ncbi:MAG: FAD-binding oxidoreductase [Pseudomonadales bacterium]|nr:FAD-binding oxidoreductase [Pseudomonadales bacterium]
MQTTSEILTALQKVFPQEKLKTDVECCVRYSSDRTELSSTSAAAVFFPDNNEDVIALVKLANELGFCIVPSGGRTGLSGGSCTVQHEVVVSLERMNRIIAYDDVDNVVHCQAGVITQNLQQYAEQKGVFYPVDFASSGSSQLGGNVATNAGGVHVMHYGMTRQQVVGLVVVTGEGKLLKFDKGLRKNNAGYDLKQLFIGSEGTLGIVTEVLLQFVKKPAKLSLLSGFDSFEKLLEFYFDLRGRVNVYAAEFYTAFCEAKVLSRFEIKSPLVKKCPFSLLVEFEDTEIATAMVSELIEKYQPIKSVVAVNQSQQKSLWAVRENISDALTTQLLLKNDIAVRPSLLSRFLTECASDLRNLSADLQLAVFGHLGDGNIHFNVVVEKNVVRTDQKFIEKMKKAIAGNLLVKLEKYHGSISAEHGIGLLKTDLLAKNESEEILGYMKQLKMVFDPKGVLNPGKVF